MGATPFGKLDGETVESLIVKAANEAMADAGIARRPTSTRSCSAISMAASRAQEFPASLVLQADPDAALQAGDPRRERLRHRLGRRPSGRARDRRRRGADRAGGRRREDDRARRRPEIGKILLKASYLPEDGDTVGGFAGVFGKIASAYFQRYGDQSDALAHDRGQEPQERRRQSLRADAQGIWLRVLPRREREEPVTSPAR